MPSVVQIENGNFARIHNEIAERLARTDLSGAEFRCLWFLLRKTYGYQKKEDTLSYSQFAEGTGLDKRSVRRALDRLIERNVICCRENGNNRPQTWLFNKYFEKWNSETEGQNAHSLPGKIASTEGQNAHSSVQTEGQNAHSAMGQNAHSLNTTEGQNAHATEGQNAHHKRYKDIDVDDHHLPGKFLRALIEGAGFAYFDKNFNEVAMRLEADYSQEQLIRAVEATKDAHRKKIGNGERGITSPLAYMKSILVDGSTNGAAKSYVVPPQAPKILTYKSWLLRTYNADNPTFIGVSKDVLEKGYNDYVKQFQLQH